jgi:hypothetical protein
MTPLLGKPENSAYAQDNLSGSDSNSPDQTGEKKELARRPTLPKQTKPPAILYKVSYISVHSDMIIHQKQSAEPFHGFLIDEEGELEETEDPVLEIRHSVTVAKASKSAEDSKIQGWRVHSYKPTSMIIHSAALIDVLRSLIDYYPKVKLSGETVEFEEPYIFLHHHKKELAALYKEGCEKFKEGQPQQLVSPVDKKGLLSSYDRRAHEHVGVLQSFLEIHFKKKIEAEERRHNPPSDRSATATFDMVWMLFKPGTRVYSHVDEKLAGFVVKSIRRSYMGYKLTLWYLDFDGTLTWLILF